ncbi:hypothetical protein P154DRAFT_244329 [Amniculicola lignicola CBS 123094]|uniref:Uncharacterized protein n=1 Tax=Amniculicola lignicola CBS 123094 TaxID=1392246 RepID=A0A6A5WDB5_9PLEO|nr:hypothetical protein P154DRAFT_244329 [Amniculicola lignicola CBS 123094]
MARVGVDTVKSPTAVSPPTAPTSLVSLWLVCRQHFTTAANRPSSTHAAASHRTQFSRDSTDALLSPSRLTENSALSVSACGATLPGAKPLLGPHWLVRCLSLILNHADGHDWTTQLRPGNLRGQ